MLRRELGGETPILGDQRFLGGGGPSETHGKVN